MLLIASLQEKKQTREGDLLRATQPVSGRSRCEVITAQVSKHHLSHGTKNSLSPI